MLYHRRFGNLPKVDLPETMTLKFSKHAVAASMSDRYKFIELRPEFSPATAELIELETTGSFDVPYKAVFRSPYDAEFDICHVIVLEPESDGRHAVKTVWLNHRNDHHRSLKVERYTQQPA
jgi:hypothetical protein